MKNSKIFSFLIGVTILCVACSPVYVPNRANTPHFQKAKDYSVEIHAGSEGYGIQGAYAPVQHLALIGGMSLYNKSKIHHWYSEIGAGYFGITQDITRFSLIGGLGTGKSEGLSIWEVKFQEYSHDVKINYLKPFLQVNAGIETPAFSGGVYLRGALVHLAYGKLNDVPVPDPINQWVMEPAIYIGIGSGPLKFSGQAGVSIPVDQYPNFTYQPFHFSIGIAYQGGKWW